MSEIIVGQKIWYAPYFKWAGEPRETTVLKVGRKWIYVDARLEARADKETMQLDGAGCSSPGRLYLSRSDWEQEKRLEEMWEKIRAIAAVRHRSPPHLTCDVAAQIIDLLSPP